MQKLDINKIGIFPKDVSVEFNKYINSEASMVIPNALSMMSAILGNRIHTYDGTMAKLYPNLWMLIVAQSGLGGKSTTIKTLKNMLLKSVLEENDTAYKKNIKAYKTLSKDEKNETAEPYPKQLISGQGSTFQGIIKSLEKNPHGLLAIYDEARELLKKLSKDTENKAGLTSLYDQEFYGKDLVGSMGKGESIHIQNPFLSILAVTNPHWLKEETTDSDYSSGFLNRFTIINIEKLPKPRAFKNIDIQDFSSFQNTALRLWKELENINSENPITLKIDKIQTMYSEWFDEKIDQYEESEEHVQSFAIRQLTAALKYAMIIQIFDCVYQNGNIHEEEYLKPEYMEIGFYLATYFMEAIEKHFELIDQCENSISSSKKVSIENLADKIISYLTREQHIDKWFNKSQLMNNISGMNADNFYDAYDVAMKKDDRLGISSTKNGKREVPQYYAETPSVYNENDEADCSMLWDDDEDVA
jgi:hypothetical protein